MEPDLELGDQAQGSRIWELEQPLNECNFGEVGVDGTKEVRKLLGLVLYNPPHRLINQT